MRTNFHEPTHSNRWVFISKKNSKFKIKTNTFSCLSCFNCIRQPFHSSTYSHWMQMTASKPRNTYGQMKIVIHKFPLPVQIQQNLIPITKNYAIVFFSLQMHFLRNHNLHEAWGPWTCPVGCVLPFHRSAILNIMVYYLNDRHETGDRWLDPYYWIELIAHNCIILRPLSDHIVLSS